MAPSVADFFADRCVLVTGASGFLGKVLVEKLLWSIPNIGTVYLVIRPQNGLDPKQRLDKLLQSNVSASAFRICKYRWFFAYKPHIFSGVRSITRSLSGPTATIGGDRRQSNGARIGTESARFTPTVRWRVSCISLCSDGEIRRSIAHFGWDECARHSASHCSLSQNETFGCKWSIAPKPNNYWLAF